MNKTDNTAALTQERQNLLEICLRQGDYSFKQYLPLSCLEAAYDPAKMVGFVAAGMYPHLYKARLTASPQPAASVASGGEFDLRGTLASKLICWHRLTVPEVDNLLEVFDAAAGGPAASVASDMPTVWAVVKDGHILGTHDAPAHIDGVWAVPYVPATAQLQPRTATRPPEGQRISVDMSTGDHDAANRVFATLAGDCASDGTWCAEFDSQNYSAAAQQLTLDAPVSEPNLLSISEQRAVLADLMGLECLINRHGCWETEADACDMAECVPGHSKRRKELLEMGRAIIAADPDCWHDEQKEGFKLSYSERAALHPTGEQAS